MLHLRPGGSIQGNDEPAATGEPGGRPAKAGIAVNDAAAGVTAVYSILAAQLVRASTGTGQYPRFASPAGRLAHVDELEAEIETVTVTRRTAEWIAVLDAAGVPAGPVYRYDETLADPQVRAREMIVEMEHPIIGPVRTLGQPAKFSRSKTGSARPAPWLGQHTREVLAELGLAGAEIDGLANACVAYDAHPERHQDG